MKAEARKKYTKFPGTKNERIRNQIGQIDERFEQDKFYLYDLIRCEKKDLPNFLLPVEDLELNFTHNAYVFLMDDEFEEFAVGAIRNRPDEDDAETKVTDVVEIVNQEFAF